MKYYTVLLLYPDYFTDNYGQETHLNTVEADTPEEAVSLARAICVSDNSDSEYQIRGDEDLFVLLVIEGSHQDINPEKIMKTCPACNNTQQVEDVFCGALGDRAQLKCRYCGMWWSTPLADVQDDLTQLGDYDDE